MKWLTEAQYKRAITRNLYELAHAKLERSVLLTIEEFNSQGSLNFFSDKPFWKVVWNGLFNSMMGHAVKVMDRHSRCASFWAIFRTDELRVRNLRAFSEERLSQIKKLTDKLSGIRNKTLFHIDRDAVFDPKEIWKMAGVTGDEFGQGLSHLWGILVELHQNVHGRYFRDPCEDYDASDLKNLLNFSVSVGLLVR